MDRRMDRRTDGIELKAKADPSVIHIIITQILLVV